MKEVFNLIAHQIEHESTLSKLYKTYSIKFPEEKIWKDLELAEKKHASLIQQLIGKVSDDTICLKDDPMRCESIKLSIERMKNEIDKIDTVEVDLLHAYKTGFEIEESMIEREFFKSLETDAPFVEDILGKIVADTEKHRESLILAKNNFLNRLNRGQISGNSTKKENDIVENKVPFTRDEIINLDRNLDNK
ncbi:MAG: hypothetical protein PF574_10340 [Candidatus Delongbacteria bacterium]|nr:hypothetical protein [Candidatus Delongbacteria bacterium]